MRFIWIVMTSVVCALSASFLHAGVIHPVSYDLPNGQLGGDVPNFFDDTYSGSGDKSTPLAALTNGLGDLTDDLVATTNWEGSTFAMSDGTRLTQLFDFDFHPLLI